jgi:hypothetical protein
VARDEQEGCAAIRGQRRVTHEDRLTVHGARELIWFERMCLESVASIKALFIDHVD